jgi:hypothetical protein
LPQSVSFGDAEVKVVKLQGGLGNQLFQYSFGRYLLERYSEEITYDASWFKNTGVYTKRDFMLFEMTDNFVLASKGSVVKQKLSRPLANNLYFESSEPFYQSELSKFYAYDGYFQDLKLGPYLFPNLLPTIKESLGEREEQSIAVHIRRGDYTSTTGIRRHGLCQWEYFRNGVEILKNILGEVDVHVYSDSELEPNLIQDINSLGWKRIETSAKASEDLIKMSCYSGLVLSNSTYSWWSAQIAVDAGKKQYVVAPTPWLGAPSKYEDALLRPSWIILDKVSGEIRREMGKDLE